MIGGQDAAFRTTSPRWSTHQDANPSSHPADLVSDDLGPDQGLHVAQAQARGRGSPRVRSGDSTVAS